MKPVYNALIVLLFPCLALAQGGTVYGKGLTLRETVSVSEILRSPEMYKGKRVVVKGEISDVCQKKGCWIKVKDPEGTGELQVKVEDDVIVFPKDAKGKRVKAEGMITVTVLSEEERRERAKHEAEEQGTLKEFDSSKIKGSAITVRMEGEGAVVE
ncbi:MAG: hypothetical protein HBSIN02_02980 [Bacteroidia bacterium]|nr:MAG: hypothetical protein HBSIN02_02980 [Bacteroidia bacterium]